MENVDDIYPLSPVQAGILFHSVRDPDAGAYFEQYGCTIRGALDTSRFQAAWNDVVARHPVLRTAFLWDGLDEPLQVVRRDATPDWQIEDWREQDPDTQDDGLARWLIENRRRGFDPAQAPLTRLALIRLAEDRHRFQWSFHHLLSDGWSTSLLINEAFGRYRDRGDAAPSAAPPPPP
ncbi:MAG: non-ribosomal peptide synthetase, partial [Phycisphaeraceae bacterium]|nr:non-ribosomal peptide synthetase [Phycisphaeraceae bacterium]